MNLQNFVILLPTVIALLIGFLVKHATPIPNKFIPLICAVVGVGINIWLNMGFSPQILAEGLVSGVASTGMFELVRNLIGPSE